MRRTCTEMALAAAFLCAAGARAEEVIYGPDGAPTVVQRKLYPMSGKWEAAALFGIALNTALVNHEGGVVALSWHPNEWLDLGVEGLFNATGLSSLVLDPAAGVRSNLRPRAPSATGCTTDPKSCQDEFKNDNQLRAGGFAVARLAPIYGKVELASEVKIHFQAFVLGGAGAASVHRESVNLCADRGTAACQHFQQADALEPAGEVGLGFRFYLGRAWSLTTQVRGYFFPSSYKVANDPTVPSSGVPQRYLAGIAVFDGGFSYLF